MARIFQNFFSGTLSATLSAGATSMSSAALASFPVVTAPDIGYLVIDPTGATPEIVKITAHTSSATTATITRGQDSTTDQTWAGGTVVIQAPITSDVSSYALDRANHSGTQTASTISDFAAASYQAAQTLNAQVGTTYTLVTGDAGKLVTLSNGSAITLTVGTALDLATGQRIDLVQTGAGQVTVAAGGATLNGTPGLKLRAQYSSASLICVGTDSYILVGDLAA